MEPVSGTGFTRNHLLERINSVIESLLMLVNVFCFLACGCGAGKHKHFPLAIPSNGSSPACSPVNKDQVKTGVLLKSKIESHAL